MAYYFQPSLTGLLVQAVGTLLMAALCIALRRTLPQPALRYWSIGWLALCVSLQGLYVATFYPGLRFGGHLIYLLGEYIFGYLVVAGCIQFARNESLQRAAAWLLLPVTVWSVGLASLSDRNVNLLFALHTLLFPYLFFRAYRVMAAFRTPVQTKLGTSVMKIALMLLTIDYMHYAPIFGTATYKGLPVLNAYLTYAPLYDLIFQVTLMFGMVMAVAGRAQHELETVNADLSRARERLETMSRTDQLTATLNRRAFSAVLGDRSRDGRPVKHGVIAVIDLDDLKALNDLYGHAAGDAALIALAAGLRSCVRSEDLLFRWGGDEFVLILMNETLPGADSRLTALEDRLRATAVPGSDTPVDLRASRGFALFDGLESLNAALLKADEAMYRQKRAG